MPTTATLKTRREVDDHHIGYRTTGVLPETYDLRWDKTSQTGCWRYDHASKRHVISISPDAFNVIADKGITRGQTELYKSIYEHEAAHSLYTTKNLKDLGDTLKTEKIPWRLMNLFEDVRIERLWWNHQRKRKHWRWTRWSKHPADIMKVTPTQLLFRFKCGDIGRKPPKAFMAFRALPFFSKVWDYFIRITNLARPKYDTTLLIPVLKDWLKDFPETGDDTIEGEGGDGTGDLAEAIAKDGGKVEDIKSATPVAAPVDDPTHAKGTSTDGGEAPDSMIRNEPVVARQVARMLASAFRAFGPTKAPTSNPSKRLNIKGLLRGDWSLPFVGKTIADNGAPYISLIFDGSGSMSGQLAYLDREKRKDCRAADAGRVLVRALSDLASKGHIQGKVYLSGMYGVMAELPLPVKDVKNFGVLWGSAPCEGIGEVLNPDATYPPPFKSAFKEITSKSKLAIVYTDGDITDTPINRDALKAKGLYTLGICCASRDKTASLRKHFDSFISRDSLFGLADALVRFLRSRKF
jgi:hypothetical protein